MRGLLWLGLIVVLGIGALIVVRRMRGRSDGAQAGGPAVATVPAPTVSFRAPGLPLTGTAGRAVPLPLAPKSATVPSVKLVETSPRKVESGATGAVVGSLRA